MLEGNERVAVTPDAPANQRFANLWLCFNMRIPARHVMLTLTALGFAVQMMIRLTMSIGVVAMVNHTAVPQKEEVLVDKCAQDSPQTNTTEYNEDGEFMWSEFTQGVVLSAFFWGCMISVLPGGHIAERFGSKLVLGVGLGICSILHLLVPLFAAFGSPWVMALRLLQGIVVGPVYPCMPALVSRWFPSDERQMAVGIINAVSALGLTATSALGGLIAGSLGWRSVFYVSGSLGLLWALFCLCFLHNTPADHPSISDEERKRIAQGNLSKGLVRRSPPYLKILTSTPVWAVISAEIGNSWILMILMTSIPIYGKSILGLDLQSNGLISGLPYLARGVALCSAGPLADLMLRGGLLSKKRIRQISVILEKGGVSLVFLLITSVGCRAEVIIFFFVISGFFNGFIGTGHFSSPLDIAPNYGGTVFALALLTGYFTSVVAPIIIGAIINEHQTMSQWGVVFYMSSGIIFTSMVLYLLLMSTEQMDWDKVTDAEDIGHTFRDRSDKRKNDKAVSVVHLSKEPKTLESGDVISGTSLEGQENRAFSTDAL